MGLWLKNLNSKKRRRSRKGRMTQGEEAKALAGSAVIQIGEAAEPKK